MRISLGEKNADQAVIFWICIWEVPALYLGHGTHYTEVFHSYYQSFQASARIVPQIMHYMMSSISFLIHYSQTTLTVDAMQCEVLKTSQINYKK
jgi:hypothetical protein